MKKYLLFAGLNYYPDRAWRNLIGDFDNISDTEIVLKNLKGSDWVDWFQIVDTETKNIEKEGKIINA